LTGRGLRTGDGVAPRLRSGWIAREKRRDSYVLKGVVGRQRTNPRQLTEVDGQSGHGE